MLFGFKLILVGLRNETPLDALTMPLSSLTLGTAIALRLHALWRQTRPHIGLGWAGWPRRWHTNWASP